MKDFLKRFKLEFFTMGYSLPMAYALSLLVGLNVEGGEVLLFMLAAMVSVHVIITLVNISK